MKSLIRWYAAANVSFPGHRHVHGKLLRICSVHYCTRERTNLFNVHYAMAHRPCGLNYSEQTFYRTYCKHVETVVVQDKENGTLDNEHLMQLAKKMKEIASETDKMALSVPTRSLTNSIKTLIDNGLSVDECLSIAKDPVTVKHLPDFTKVYSALIQHGFPSAAVIEMVKQSPNLLTLKEEQLFSKYEALRKLGFTDSPLEIIVTKAPKILNEDIKGVTARYGKLREFFKINDVNELCEKTPELMFEDPKKIEEKIEYAKSTMDVPNRQILQSDFFSHTQEHIEARHSFLVRTGFFKIIKKTKGQVDTNPAIRDIVDTSDEEFAKRFGNMSLKDYETFKKLLENEKKLWKEGEEWNMEDVA